MAESKESMFMKVDIIVMGFERWQMFLPAWTSREIPLRTGNDKAKRNTIYSSYNLLCNFILIEYPSQSFRIYYCSEHHVASSQ